MAARPTHASRSSGNPFNGIIDDFVVYDQALSSQQVSDHFAAVSQASQ